MTQSPIEPPNDPRRSDDRPAAAGPRRLLDFDEMVALFVAFLSLGGVLFWGLGRGEMKLFSDDALTTPPVATVPGGSTDSLLGGDTDAAIAPEEETLGAAAFVEDDVDAEPTSAVDELSAQAAARRDRLATRKPVWEDVKDGMTGAAAGVAGAAVTANGVDAATLPGAESEELPDVVAAGTSAEVDAAGSEDVPDIGALVPPKPSQAATGEPQDAIAFTDVPDDYWAKPYIDALSSRGLISGFDEGEFRPEAEVTRAQTANIVSRTFELTADKENLEFSDVSSDYWARESIGEVVRGGFMTGFPDDTFDPGAPVTRTQALITLVTGLGIESPTNVQASLDRYTDANEIPNWANEKVAAATAGSLVVNYPEISELNPAEPTTRAELSAMIYQALVREGVLEPVETTYVVKP